MTPFVSVIIPVFNAEKFIAKSIASVLKQTFSNFELIVIDDGSSDQSVKVIREFQDVRIKLYSQSNSGQCKALNFGLANATGQFIKFLDADDYLNPVHLEKLVELIASLDEKQAERTLVLSRWQRFSGEDNLFPIVDRPEWGNNRPMDFIVKALGNGPDMLPGWQWLIPKKLIERVGSWNENLGLGNDFEFSVRLILGSDQILFCHESIVYYRSDLQSNMSSSTSISTIMSVLTASRTGIKNILAVSNTDKVKQVCADKLQIWLLSYLPYIKSSLAKEVEQEVKALGGSDVNADWDKKMLFLKKLIGWKATKMFQYYYYRFRYKQ